MLQTCHRCGGDLPDDTTIVFCLHCGAPQLHMAEGCSIEQAEVTLEAGAAPPPPLLRGVEWKTALQAAAMVALAGVVLNLLSARLPALSFFSSLWLFGGPMIALAVYQRRQPMARINAGVGARIGLVVGLGTVAGLAISLALIGVVARYSLHSMAGFDAQMAAWMKVQVDHAIATNPAPPETVRYLSTPEFRTGFVLVFLAMSGVFLLTAATLAGALGGLVQARRVRPA